MILFDRVYEQIALPDVLLRGNTLKYDDKYNNDDVIHLIHNANKTPFNSALIQGHCPNANVLIFALEALSSEGYAKSEYAKKIQAIFDSKIDCEHFYSVCPNTNQSAYQIYTSCYGEKTDYFHLKKLGYQSTYISTQNSSHFKLNELLLKFGIDEIIDNRTLNEKNNDYDLLSKINDISDGLKRGKAFYHVTNLQTHSPYSVVDTETFQKTQCTAEKSTYLNAVDEVLFIVYTMLMELKKRGDLDNTIVVVTGDHGESFGEFGYYTHSASTVNSQIKIPLNIFHPNLSSQHIKSGCLMDLMPSLLDLLGVDFSAFSMDGQSLFQLNRDYLLCYSETKGANSPSNACVIVGDKKYYADTVQNRYLILDKEDQILVDDPKEVARIQSIVYCALEKHGLIR
jgi:membrane-anchored protein YejM (alkaline phosphatase superfamily)